ncbi:Hypothetical protein CGLY_16540 (plasmid) [Corynebacterium glyciniphilum AJ 3170]|uniref:PqqD family protein n=2 Tax=Corynebacterium TaxID=1716 RepID=X5EGG6_9CORY|nr:Hypothetical protein CGLY_16540 [Corynebacterium glyciniphilum AJ 3170]
MGANVRNVGGTLYVAKRQTVRELNDVAVLIWRTIESGATVSEIVDVVTSEYSVSEEEAERDTIDFLSSLEQDGLVVASDNG